MKYCCERIEDAIGEDCVHTERDKFFIRNLGIPYMADLRPHIEEDVIMHITHCPFCGQTL